MLSSRDELRRVIHNSLEAIPAEPPTAAAVPIYLPNKDTSLSRRGRRRQRQRRNPAAFELHSRNSRVDYALIIINFTHSLSSPLRTASKRTLEVPSGPHRSYDLCPALKYTHTQRDRERRWSFDKRELDYESIHRKTIRSLPFSGGRGGRRR